MKKIVIATLLAIVGLVALEMVSSFVLFRYFAHGQKSFRPERLATLMLLAKVVDTARGIHPRTVLSVDHRPVFEPDETMGYVFVPGRYLIKEDFKENHHGFTLTVNAQGRRVTSNFPHASSSRLFVSGSSSMFGWGLYDEETIPWLLQERLPKYEVVNLSLTSYSTVLALMQLQKVNPAINSNDIVVVEYQRISNRQSVMSPDILDLLSDGFEVTLGDSARMRKMSLPYGMIDPQGKLSIQRIRLACLHDTTAPDCSRPAFDPADAARVTEHAIDEIMALHPGHVVIAVLSCDDDDPVLVYLRSRDVTIADLRARNGLPVNTGDIMPTNSHYGPFWEHELADRLIDIMHERHLLD